MAAVNTHPEDIKAEIRKTGISVWKLGQRYGVAGNTLCKSLYVPCPKGNRVIADYLGRPLHAIWPEWYGPDGQRLSSPSKNPSTRAGAAHRQKRRAA